MFPVRIPTSFPSNVYEFCRNCQASELADEHKTGKIQVKEALATTKKLNGVENSISDAETDDETKPNIEHKLEDEAKDERLNDLVNEMLSLMVPLYAKNMNDTKNRITTQMNK